MDQATPAVPTAGVIFSELTRRSTGAASARVSKSQEALARFDRVLTARDGRDALRLVQREPPNAIVLDLRLPNVDGWQVIRWCRAHPAATAIPIIVVSAARDAPQDADIEPLVFVEKPFDLDVLLVLVQDAVSPSPPYVVA